jgi:cytochrome c-type biogenesis protein CcmH
MRAVLVMLLVVVSTVVPAAEPEPWPAEQEARYQALIAELRCLVCQNQNIAESNAPLADDLRRQVREMMLRGDSDRQILDYMTARYGDFVLYRPPFKPRTWALWFVPFILLAAGLLVAVVVYRRRGQPSVESVPDSETIRRILKDPKQQ